MSMDNKVPEVRFKGFSEEWEEKGLGEVFTYERPDNYIVKSSVYSDEYHTPVLTANKGFLLGYTHEKSTYNDPSIIFDDFTLDCKFVDFPYMVKSSAIKILTVKNSREDDLIFAFHLLNTAQIEVMGHARHYISVVQNTKVSIPKKNEQIMISNYFQKLDSLINQHQQKHDKLNNIKKAMLEKMFPKQGETIPEIRFKGFSREWDEISLLDSIERIIDFRGRTPKKLGLDWSSSGHRALSALNVKQGYIDFSIDPHFGDQELYDKWMSGSELHQGQVLFTTEAPMGNVAQVPNTDKYILSQRTIAFIVKYGIIAEDFLAVLLRSSKVFRELSALSSGGTAKGVSQKVLANLNVSIPTDLVEQSAIGNYFQKLDALINQHQQQITKLNNIKQACLSKMFV
ncbi:restriction endonuclease subunit S (plasmid) [Arsenophonus nasoniae]|uniref:Restriction endonuclease subunit S n=2 Tax=Arsenophonus nasoniae TaxID=638 RepID=A0A4P7LBX1_9GAMM|nr:restriction endonuclease subunit S [Arsenophonus nasoniae]QBY46622.1 Type I restriction modification DNA specificity domain protein [Arsenophonus nasoniae]WGM08342.1 restriction endonuclease subunit S [Arsenophonus nasoniae]WGM13207.1 restriction endonuclease subunit S [Arsenophonus nasoniae]